MSGGGTRLPHTEFMCMALNTNSHTVGLSSKHVAFCVLKANCILNDCNVAIAPTTHTV